MTVIRRFVEWLGYHPTTEEIARALATEFFSEFSIKGLRFGRLNNDDSITNLGQFGFPDLEALRGQNIPSHQWRAGNSQEVEIVSGISKDKWTPDSKMYVATVKSFVTLVNLFSVSFVSRPHLKLDSSRWTQQLTPASRLRS